MINKEQINILRENLKGTKNYLSISYLGCNFLIFEISHRKVINKLLKFYNFEKCLNPAYIQHKTIKDFYLRFSPVSYKKVFMVEISKEDYNKLKEDGLKEVLKDE